MKTRLNWDWLHSQVAVLLCPVALAKFTSICTFETLRIQVSRTWESTRQWKANLSTFSTLRERLPNSNLKWVMFWNIPSLCKEWRMLQKPRAKPQGRAVQLATARCHQENSPSKNSSAGVQIYRLAGTTQYKYGMLCFWISQELESSNNCKNKLN